MYALKYSFQFLINCKIKFKLNNLHTAKTEPLTVLNAVTIMANISDSVILAKNGLINHKKLKAYTI